MSNIRKKDDPNRYYKLRAIFEFLGAFSIFKQPYIYISLVVAILFTYIGLGTDSTFIQTLMISDITLFGFTVTAFSILISLNDHTVDYLKNILRVPAYIFAIGQFTWTEILLFTGFVSGGLNYALISDSFSSFQFTLRGAVVSIPLATMISYPFYFFSIYGIMNTFISLSGVLRLIAVTRGRADDDLKSAWDEGIKRIKEGKVKKED